MAAGGGTPTAPGPRASDQRSPGTTFAYPGLLYPRVTDARPPTAAAPVGTGPAPAVPVADTPDSPDQAGGPARPAGPARPDGLDTTDGSAGRLRKFRPDIEGLRAVAVILVVLGHSGLALPGGFVGVDVFFVISGFLITRQLITERSARGRISLAGFYARRARRIVPAATVVIVATMLGAWRWVSPLRIHSTGVDAALSAVSAINIRLAQAGTDYLRAEGPPSPFQHFWSLAVEEQFYAVWPLLLVVTAALVGPARRRRTGPVAVLLLVVVVASLTLSAVLTPRSAPWAYFGSHTRAWELALGALVALGAPRLGRLRPALSAQLTWLGLAGILVAACVFGEDTLYPGLVAVLPVAGSALVIAGGCAAPRRGAELLLRRRPCQLVGRVSYSWYLWHWPVLVLWPLASGEPLRTGEKLAAIALSLVLAVLTYHLVENPIRRRPVLARRPALGLGLGLVSSGAAVLVALLVAQAAALPTGGPTATTSLAAAVGATVGPGPLSPDGPAASGADPAAPGADPAGTGAVTVRSAALTGLIERSLDLGDLPGGLRPSLEQAPNDYKSNRCYTSITSGTPTDCVYGDPQGRRTVVLFGDSHANQWFNAMNEVSRRNGWRLVPYTKGGCPPADYPNFVLETLKRVYTECNTWRADVLGRIRALSPDLVVIGSEARTEAIRVGPGGMTKVVRDLRSTGAKVVLIEDTPYPGFDVPDCLARNPTNVRRCIVRVAGAKLTEPQRAIEIRGAAAGGAMLVDPVPWLCTKDECPPIIGDTIVYYDKSHITGTYSTALASYLGPALVRLAG
ncbi:acyltransferase family protein [Frankia sp. R43]|uniref:acyltransferase family protein n=1 Tax=Frankia sp. R43 TaxID=269536 RepID=UPI0009F8FEDD|nr:acyltransferase family protein [Frankia sp. R43]